MFLSPLAMFIGQINLISDGTLPCLHRAAIRHLLSDRCRCCGALGSVHTIYAEGREFASATKLGAVVEMV